MITIAKTVSQRILVSLTAQNNDVVNIVFSSPSRPTITFEKSLTQDGEGFFYFTLLESEAAQFVDDTYSYQIVKNGEVLKLGKVRLTTGEEFGFDYELDFLLA